MRIGEHAAEGPGRRVWAKVGKQVEDVTKALAPEAFSSKIAK